MKNVILFTGFILIIVGFSFGQKVGDKVKVSKNGKYYTATVKQIKGSKFYVDYDGLKSSMNEWIGKDRIKTTKTTGNNTGGKTNTDGGDTKVNPKTNTSNNNPSWNVGDKVMVLNQGFWESATILQIHNGMYKIHYNGYASSKNDEWVPPARIKNQ